MRRVPWSAVAERGTSGDTALATRVSRAPPVRPPEIPSEGGVALTLPTALQGLRPPCRVRLHHAPGSFLTFTSSHFLHQGQSVSLIRFTRSNCLNASPTPTAFGQQDCGSRMSVFFAAHCARSQAIMASKCKTGHSLGDIPLAFHASIEFPPHR